MRKALILMVLALLFGIIPTSAQNDLNPLFQMLERIPNTPAARERLTYVDYRALLAARPGAPTVASWEEFNSLIDQRDDQSGLLMSALMGIQSGPEFFARYLMEAENTPNVVGFDLFEIERAAEYGSPPASVTVLEGDFDHEAIYAAYDARDYTQNDSGGLTLLCPAAGCNTGMQTNLADREVANPFGGALGRNQPVLIGEQWIASSASHQALGGVAEAVAGDKASLADDADYAAAAEAIAASGTPLQAYFIRPLDVNSVSAAILANPRMTQEQIEAIMSRLEADFVPLPQYNLIALAHAATETEELALITLVYSDTATAEAAAELFPEHLENYTTVATRQPFSEILSDRGVTLIDTTIHESSERAALVIALHSPLPDTEPLEGERQLRTMGLPFSALVQAYMRRDLGWLATGL